MTATARLESEPATDADLLAMLIPPVTGATSMITMRRVRDLRVMVRSLLLEHANGPVPLFGDGHHRARVAQLMEMRLLRPTSDGRATQLTSQGSAVVCALLARMAESLLAQRRGTR